MWPDYPLKTYPLRIASVLTVVFPFLLVVGSAVADGAMSLIALLFLMRSAMEKDWRWCKERWVQCLLLLWIYMIVRSLFAEVPSEALHRSLPFVRYFVFAAGLGYWTLQDARTYERFFAILKILVLFLALDGLLQWLTGSDVLRHLIVVQPDGNLRLTGPFKTPVLGIMLTWLSFPVCLEMLLMKKDAVHKTSQYLAAIATPLLMFATIAVSGERMALLLALFGWGIAVLLMSGYRYKLFTILCAGIALIGVLVFASPMLMHRQATSTVHTVTTWWDSPYGILLNSDLKAAKVNPVLGVGANHFRIVCPRLYTGSEDQLSHACNIHPHNIYMEWLIEEGVIGFILFMAFLVFITQKCIQNWGILRKNPIFAGFCIAFILRVWPIMSSTGFFSRWGAPPFWLVLGVLLVYTVRKEPSDVDSSLAV